MVNAQTPEKENAGLSLPAGFSASIVAENIGKARHLVVTSQGDIYVRLAKPVNGKGTLLLHETNGKATVQDGFGIMVERVLPSKMVIYMHLPTRRYSGINSMKKTR